MAGPQPQLSQHRHNHHPYQQYSQNHSHGRPGRNNHHKAPKIARHELAADGPRAPVRDENSLPPASRASDAEQVILDRLASANVPDNVQQYPIRARRQSHDPIADGIVAVGPDLGPTLLPMLQQPLPQGPENIGLPNCRGVKGAGGAMISFSPGSPRGKQSVQTSTKKSPPSARPAIRAPVQDPTLTPTLTPTPTPTPTQAQAQAQAQVPIPAATAVPATAVAATNGHSSPVEGQAPSSGQVKKEPDSEFKIEFRFVVNEDAKTARNTVRQHVMREFRRRERWEQGKHKVSKSKKAVKREKLQDNKGDSQAEHGVPRARQPALRSPDHQGTVGADNRDSERRSSQSMSVSGQSDTSDSDAGRLTALLQQSPPRKPVPEKPPFAQYVDQGLVMTTEGVEEAVEEIERAELSHLPYKHDPWAEVARAEINPFSTQLTIGAGSASRALLHHYAWVMPSLMDEIVTGTVFHRIGWLYSAVAPHDPTPFHTIVGFTLGHVAMLRGIEEPPMAIEHKEKSLQLIHGRMANPLLAASDGSIGAIANIASFELIDCNPERFTMHMRGLSRLVTQRGGMSDFAANIELETVLVRLDVIRAYMTISQPRFPAWVALRSLTPLAINIGPAATEWFCTPAEQHMLQYLFCEDAIRLIHNLEDVLTLMRSVYPTIPFVPDPSLKSLLIDSIVHAFRRDTIDATSGFANHVSRRVIRLAAFVLIDIASMEYFIDPPSSAPNGQHTHGFPAPSFASESLPSPTQPSPERSPGSPQAPADKKGLGLNYLRGRFPALDQHRHTWGRSVEMITAVLLQAQRMALERPFRAWYVADIITLTMKLGTSEWQAVESVLVTDIMQRIQEDRSRSGLAANGGADGVPNASKKFWDLGEIAGRFWAEWQ